MSIEGLHCLPPRVRIYTQSIQPDSRKADSQSSGKTGTVSEPRTTQPISSQVWVGAHEKFLTLNREPFRPAFLYPLNVFEAVEQFILPSIHDGPNHDRASQLPYLPHQVWWTRASQPCRQSWVGNALSELPISGGPSSPLAACPS